jgi:hypothetical protein
MKHITALLTLAVCMVSAQAPAQPPRLSEDQLNQFSIQSKLPPCPLEGMRINCFGRASYPNGAKYVGEYGDRVWEGHGVFTWPDGRKYVGMLEDGRFHGQGAEYGMDGLATKMGIWDRDNFVREGVVAATQNPSAQTKADETQELVRLRIEAQAAMQRQRELEDQLKQSQPQLKPTAQIQQTPFLGKRVALVIGNAAYKIHPPP